MHKRTRRVVLAAVVVLLLAQLFRPGPLDRAAARVRSGPEALTALAESILAKGNAVGCEYPGVREITYDRQSGWLEFRCGGAGFVPSASYYGFYYAPDAVPIGFQGVPVPLVPDGAGWRWDEADGDNWYYTEPVLDHWYVYEMHF